MDNNEKTKEQLIKEIEQLNEEKLAIIEIFEKTLGIEDFEKAAKIIFDACKAFTGATAGYVALLSKNGQENEVLFLDAGGRPCSVDESLPMPIRGLRAESYNNNKVVYENNFNNSRWKYFMPEGHAALDNVLFSPLIIKDKTVGIIGIANKQGDFTEKDVQITTIFGHIAAGILNNINRLKIINKNKKELEEKTEYLEKMNNIMTGRELRIVELKKMVDQLSRDSGKSEPFGIS